jgi:hypothetical protein
MFTRLLFCEETKVSDGNNATLGVKDSTILQENFNVVLDPEAG